MDTLKDSFIEIMVKIPKPDKDKTDYSKRFSEQEDRLNQRIEDSSSRLLDTVLTKGNILKNAFDERIGRLRQEILNRNNDLKDTFDNKLSKLNDTISKQNDRLLDAFHSNISDVLEIIKRNSNYGNREVNRSKDSSKSNTTRIDSLKQAFEEKEAKLQETIRKLRAEKKQVNQNTYPSPDETVTKRGYGFSDFFATIG